jgi:hypothetical protein
MRVVEVGEREDPSEAPPKTGITNGVRSLILDFSYGGKKSLQAEEKIENQRPDPHFPHGRRVAGGISQW